jgi:hypothetical protein
MIHVHMGSQDRMDYLQSINISHSIDNLATSDSIDYIGSMDENGNTTRQEIVLFSKG